MWHRVRCVWSVYDPWDEPELAFIEGKDYRGYEYEDGHWDVHSSETRHSVDFDAGQFNQCFMVVL